MVIGAYRGSSASRPSQGAQVHYGCLSGLCLDGAAHQSTLPDLLRGAHGHVAHTPRRAARHRLAPLRPSYYRVNVLQHYGSRVLQQDALPFGRRLAQTSRRTWRSSSRDAVGVWRRCRWRRGFLGNPCPNFHPPRSDRDLLPCSLGRDVVTEPGKPSQGCLRPHRWHKGPCRGRGPQVAHAQRDRACHTQHARHALTIEFRFTAGNLGFWQSFLWRRA